MEIKNVKGKVIFSDESPTIRGTLEKAVKDSANLTGANLDSAIFTEANLTINCGAKHTKYQPTMEEWKCPSCGIKDDGEHFYIDDGEHFYIDVYDDDIADLDCNLLHEKDGVVCTNCNKAWIGETLSKIMAKIANMVPCPNCKGAGFVKKP